MKKKILSLFIVTFLLLSLTLVSAQSNGKQIIIKKGFDVAKGVNITKPKVIGLELALEKVTNKIARNRIQENINRLENITKDYDIIDTEKGIEIKAQKRARFLGLFPIDRTNIFEVDENGEFKRKTRFWDWIFVDEKINLNGDKNSKKI